MPHYTLCLLLRENLSEADCEKVLQEVKKNLPDSVKPEIISWGRRDLAYPIAKETQAFYYLVNFEADSTTPGVLDKKLTLADQVLRFLVVRRAKKATKAPKETKEPKVRKATKAKKTKTVAKTKKTSKKRGR